MYLSICPKKLAHYHLLGISVGLLSFFSICGNMYWWSLSIVIVVKAAFPLTNSWVNVPPFSFCLPSKAFAKISMRLVPDQDWEEISDLFMTHFKAIAPPTVKVSVKKHHGGQPYVTPTDSIGYKAAFMALEESFGKKPVPTRGGGSIPIVALFEQELGLKSILFGFGLDSDALHSPNEHYGIFNFMKGIETIPLFYKYFKELNG